MRRPPGNDTRQIYADNPPSQPLRRRTTTAGRDRSGTEYAAHAHIGQNSSMHKRNNNSVLQHHGHSEDPPFTPQLPSSTAPSTVRGNTAAPTQFKDHRPASYTSNPVTEDYDSELSFVLAPTTPLHYFARPYETLSCTENDTAHNNRHHQSDSVHVPVYSANSNNFGDGQNDTATDTHGHGTAERVGGSIPWRPQHPRQVYANLQTINGIRVGPPMPANNWLSSHGSGGLPPANAFAHAMALPSSVYGTLPAVDFEVSTGGFVANLDATVAGPSSLTPPPHVDCSSTVQPIPLPDTNTTHGTRPWAPSTTFPAAVHNAYYPPSAPKPLAPSFEIEPSREISVDSRPAENLVHVANGPGCAESGGARLQSAGHGTVTSAKKTNIGRRCRVSPSCSYNDCGNCGKSCRKWRQHLKSCLKTMSLPNVPQSKDQCPWSDGSGSGARVLYWSTTTVW
ncbi:uncharacterized protein B0H18DRAFT_593668 [Fomitopsis serialis]|uniref:uncharacterized protein n=1 Tax=Fomitopsis serialis TaxID=139415 RepID=UPI0020088D66|nr:uncharacterized protein B0H18DRAFT_593668 [Neoantrodia serialis]KAH9920462.1 hypothetical protein B0H18DRAFT_593668 [Neoantrodia serialis]